MTNTANKTSPIKRAAVLLLACVLAPALLSAQKEHTRNIMCPVDGTMFAVPVTENITVTGLSRDLEKLGDIGYHYSTMICSCPTCRYSGYHEDFGGPFTRKAKEDITRIIAPYKNQPPGNAVKCEIAAKLNIYFGDSNDRIANIYRVGSYLLRGDRNQESKRKDLQRQCIVYLKKAVEAREYSLDSDYITAHYLIGEFSRRTGGFSQAIQYFDMVLKSPLADPTLLKYAAEQKKAAQSRDDSNGI